MGRRSARRPAAVAERRAGFSVLRSTVQPIGPWPEVLRSAGTGMVLPIVALEWGRVRRIFLVFYIAYTKSRIKIKE